MRRCSSVHGPAHARIVAPDQKNVLAYVAWMPESDNDIMTLPLEGDEAHGWKPGRPTVVVNSAASEQGPVFSPDGKWLSYSSNESGLDQVYVGPFPGPGARVMVSNAGGATCRHGRAKRVPSWCLPRQRLTIRGPHGRAVPDG